jgi:hypothetical protein
MAIGIKTDSEYDCLLVPFLSHDRKVNPLPDSSSGKKPPAKPQLAMGNGQWSGLPQRRKTRNIDM